jgi:hypothetical protein
MAADRPLVRSGRGMTHVRDPAACHRLHIQAIERATQLTCASKGDNTTRTNHEQGRSSPLGKVWHMPYLDFWQTI